ncbi:methionine synthase reductase-like [Lineus longissimus]|uniref:methionine synthase reductase-like n=1 Tax=Lineus longissimus TaxID=88925 RepID=UPI002B4DF2AF
MTNKPKFLLIYGSQTGQAEAIAEEIRDNAGAQGLEADLHCMDKTEKKFNLDRAPCVVIVVSTTGEGDAPDNAQKLWRRLKKRTLQPDHLGRLNYALLGLGDSNYVSFCMCGKNFDRRLQELGARRFYNSGWGDDAVGLEVAVEPWIQGLWEPLRKFLGLETETTTGMNETSNGKSERQLNGHSEERYIKENGDVEKGDGDTSTSGSIIPIGNTIGNSWNGDSKNMKTEAPSAESDTVPNDLFSSQTEDKMHSNKTDKACSTGSHSEEEFSKKTTCDVGEETKVFDVTTGTNVTSLTDVTAVTGDTALTDVSKVTDVTSMTDDTKVSVARMTAPSLWTSVAPLSESGLSLPPLAATYLVVEYKEELTDVSSLPIQNGHKLPSAATDVTMVPVAKVTKLTRDDAVKTALEIELSLEGTSLAYRPGDSFSVICPNQDREVEMIIKRLSLEDVCDKTYALSIMSGTKKKNASIPGHLHPAATLRHTLLTCCDIRQPPKKAFLRMLVEYTDNPAEKRRLQELCSKQGAADYTSYIREPNLGIIDILAVFESCHPPVEGLLEHLPRLQPRPYSASSSPLSQPNRLRFVFNTVEIPAGDGRGFSRPGVCTGWLSSLANSPVESPLGEASLEEDIENLKITENRPKIPVFLRTSQHFHLPEDPSLPVIMIGPGTGVAPFIGFLSHRQEEVAVRGTQFGKMWLFYGCRHKERDYLYEKEIKGFKDERLLTELSVCFSRDPIEAPQGNVGTEEAPKDRTTPKYVQDNIRLHAEDVLRWICDEDAVVYVCGDAKNMARNVNETFAELLTKLRGIEDAKGYLMKMRLKKHYHEDIWT